MSNLALDYLKREIMEERKYVLPENMTPREYALLQDAYRFVLARIEVARLM